MSGELTAVKPFLFPRTQIQTLFCFWECYLSAPTVTRTDVCLLLTRTQTPHPRDTKHPYTHQLESRQGFAPLPLLSNIWDMYAWWAMSHSSVLFFCSLQFCCRYFFPLTAQKSELSDHEQTGKKGTLVHRHHWNLSLSPFWAETADSLISIPVVQKSNKNHCFKKEPVKCSVYITQAYYTSSPDSFIQSWPLVVTAFLCGSLAIFNHCNLFCSLPSSTGHYDEVQPF